MHKRKLIFIVINDRNVKRENKIKQNKIPM